MIGETIGGRYTILSHLGTGGMGAVYEARHTGTGRRVALKLITESGSRNKDRIRRFKVEARAAGVIESEHIAQVLDLDEDEERGVPFLAMELLEGDDLKQLLQRLGALPVDVATRIALQACRGLSKAHEKRIVHRDIKPANIYLARRDTGRRVVKLLDFGIAKFRADGDTASALEAGLDRNITATGTMMGTPTYMSPEQTNGLKKTDHRTDVWAMGVVLYEMLRGTPPHADAEGMGDLMIRICRHPVHTAEGAPWIPPALAAVVDRALTIDIEKRWQSFDDMVAALEELLPDGCDLEEAMLVPLDDTMRSNPPPPLRRSASALSAEIASATTVGVSGPVTTDDRSTPPRRSRLLGAVVGGAVVAMAAVAIAVGSVGGGSVEAGSMSASSVADPAPASDALKTPASTGVAAGHAEPAGSATTAAPASASASVSASTSAAASAAGPGTRPPVTTATTATTAPPVATTAPGTATAPPAPPKPTTTTTATAKPGPTMKETFE